MKGNSVFDAYGHYYDLLYQDKDYIAEVEYLDSLLKKHGITGRELLEFGSGTGRHGRLLAEKNYNISGIEISEQMVQETQLTDGFTCQQGDIRTIKLDRYFDAVIALFHVMSYQTLNTELQAVFQRAFEHLRKGGLFVFDVWYSPAVYKLHPETRVKRMIDDEIEIIRIAEPENFPNDNRVDVNYTVFVRDKTTNTFQTFSETHPMRHFSIPEIDFWAATNGFKCFAAEEFLTGAVPGEHTWGVCFVLRKI